MAKIVVLGSCNTDLISYTPRFPIRGETIVGTDFQMGCGGKGANQAVMAAKMGCEVTMISKVGKDVFGDQFLKAFENVGVLKDFVRYDEKPTGTASIIVEKSGQNMIVISPGANFSINKSDVDRAVERIKESKMIITQLEINMETTIYGLKTAKENGIITLLNPAPATTLPEHVYSLCDYLCPNESEASILLQEDSKEIDDPKNWSIEKAKSAAEQLRKRGPKVVILTLGEKGAIVCDKNQTTHVTIDKIENVVDTTGAGDCFIGAFAFYITSGLETVVAVEKACKVASMSVMKHGTQTSFPDLIGKAMDV